MIERSHELGRIDHVLTGEQAGADQGRVEEILKVLPLIYVKWTPATSCFSSKPASPLGPEPIGESPLVDDLLL